MEENIILEIEHEDGSKSLKALVEFFESQNGNTYAVLLPLNEDGVIESADYEIVRAKPIMDDEGLQDYEIESIHTEDEMNAVSEELRVKWVAELNDEVQTFDAIEQEEEYAVVEVTDEKGVKHECYIADVFQARGRTYAALARVSERDKDERTYYLFRAEQKAQDGTEGVELSPIVSDMEFEDVNSIFEEERVSLL